MYQYNGTITTSTPQTAGQFAFFQSGGPLATTHIYFNYTYFTGGDASSWLTQLTSSTNPIKGRLRISINGTQNTFVDFNINAAYTTTGSGATLTYIIPVFTVISNNLISLAVNDICTVSFAFAGDIGSASLPPATIEGQYLVWDGSTWVIGTDNAYLGETNLNLGAYALDSLPSSGHTGNVAVGYQAMTNSTSGSYNTAIGASAMSLNTAGDNNIVIGYNSQILGSSSNTNVIGYNVTGQGSNTTVIKRLRDADGTGIPIPDADFSNYVHYNPTSHEVTYIPEVLYITSTPYTLPAGASNQQLTLVNHASLGIRYSPYPRNVPATSGGTNGTVYAMDNDENVATGEIIIGGNFTTAGPSSTPVGRICRVSHDGLTIVSTLNDGVDGIVYSIYFDLYGYVGYPTIYAGGDFLGANTGGSTQVNRISYYDTNAGTWFPMGAGGPGLDSTVRAITKFDTFNTSGLITVAGNFTDSVGTGTKLNKIAYYDPTTDLFQSLIGLPYGVSSNSTPVIYATYVTPTYIYVGGSFQFVAGGVGAKNIARYDIANQQWSALIDSVKLGDGTDGPVYAITGDPSNPEHLYVGGFFYYTGQSTSGFSYAGVSCNNIAYWDNGVSRWFSLQDTVTQNQGTQNTVYAIKAVTISGNNFVFVGGQFSYVSAASIDPFAPAGPSIVADNIAVFQTIFTAYSGQWFPIYFSGGTPSIAPSFQCGLDSTVYALEYNNNNNYLIAGGQFLNVYDGNGTTFPMNYITSYNIMGSPGQWSILGNGTTPGGALDNTVYALAVDQGSNIVYAGGSFQQDLDNPTNPLWGIGYYTLAAGMNWSQMFAPSINPANDAGTGSANPGTVYALSFDSNSGTLWAGGLFQQMGSIVAENMAQWQSGSWQSTTFGNSNSGGTNARVNAVNFKYLGASSQDLLVIGGEFQTFSTWDTINTNTINVNYMTYALNSNTSPSNWGNVSWNNALYIGGQPGFLGVSDYVNAICYLGGELYVGGSLTQVNGLTGINNLIKWVIPTLASPTIGYWSPIVYNPVLNVNSPGEYGVNNVVTALETNGGQLYVGGQFLNTGLTVGGTFTLNYVGILDPFNFSWTQLIKAGGGIGLNNIVHSLSFNSTSNQILIGGVFTDTGGTAVLPLAGIATFANNTSELFQVLDIDYNGVAGGSATVYTVLQNSFNSFVYRYLGGNFLTTTPITTTTLNNMAVILPPLGSLTVNGSFNDPLVGPVSSIILDYYDETTHLIYDSTDGIWLQANGPYSAPVPQGTYWADYLYWNDLTSKWTVGSDVVRLGRDSGQYGQNVNSVAIGYEAANTGQASYSIAIGYYAGASNQSLYSVAIGNEAAQFAQNVVSIAIGDRAGQNNQSFRCLAIGSTSGQNNQNSHAIAIGDGTAQNNQGTYSIAIGYLAGQNNQNSYSLAIGHRAGSLNQASNSIALGTNAGIYYQSQNCIAIGNEAGQTGQQSFSIAIGYQAGFTNQQGTSIALGYQSGYLNQQGYSVAIGYQSGYSNQQQQTVAIGYQAGYTGQNLNSVAIGNQAGWTAQTGHCVAIGYQAGKFYQNQYSVAIGYQAGFTAQSLYCVAMGYQAGYSGQQQSAIAIGREAGNTQQGLYSIAIGYQAGLSQQQQYSVAIGYQAGATKQTQYSVAIGYQAGSFSQSLQGVAIGVQAGQTYQGLNSVAIGYQAGAITQSGQAIAIGYQAGYFSQQTQSVAIGSQAGSSHQGSASIAIGYQAGAYTQQSQSVAIGFQAGMTKQGTQSIAIGYQAGAYTQLGQSVAIGFQAGSTQQGTASIAIGYQSGAFTQSANAVAVGYQAAYFSQQTQAIAIGYQAGQTLQGTQAIAMGFQAGQSNQSSGSVAIGYQAGYRSQGTQSIAIGYQAGGGSSGPNFIQGARAIAIGASAGLAGQQTFSIAIGYNAAVSSQQQLEAVAIGYFAGSNFQGQYAVALGSSAGSNIQGNYSVAVGNQAGSANQGQQCVSVGYYSAIQSQGQYAVALGAQAAVNSQGEGAIAIGWQAGQTFQGTYSVAIGYQSGKNTQSRFAVAVGYQSGLNSQGTQAVAIGYQAGSSQQGTQSVAIGAFAGSSQQGSGSIAIGAYAGGTQQGQQSVAIGLQTAQYSQGNVSVAIGAYAGFGTQGIQAVAIGYQAGGNTQGSAAVAIGGNAGVSTQGSGAVAVGGAAGQFGQQTGAVAIGYTAGNTNQGTNSIAIGSGAGQTNQHQNSIIINATGIVLNSQTQSAFYAAPIRQASAANTLYYDTTFKEIVYEGAATIEAINMSNFGQTSKLTSIPYSSNQQITTSNINAKTDNWVDNAQTYTFGPTVQARYVAGGAISGGTPHALYSADGINWFASPNGNIFGTGQGNCAAYNGNIWVLGGSGSGGSMYYSYDGIRWIQGSLTGSISFFGVAWGKDKFVAIAQTNIYYSYDGINWNTAANNIFTTSGTGQAVAFNGSRWVAVGTNFAATTAPSITLAYSADGITWTAALTNSFGATVGVSRGYGVAWNGIRWVAVGTNATTSTVTVVYSSDGISWTQVTTGTTFNGAGGIGRGVAWNGIRFVAVGANLTTTPNVTGITSLDGITWTATTTNIFTNASSASGRSIMWTGTKWIAGGVGATGNVNMLYSFDGLSWLSVVTTPYNVASATCSAIAYNSVRPNQITFPRNIVVATGGYLSPGPGLLSTNIYSIDGGLTWVAGTSIFGTTSSSTIGGYCVAYNGKIWLAGGTNATTPTITLAYSFDGIVWTAVNNFTTNIMGNLSGGVCRGIAWSPILNIWVAVGHGSATTPTNGLFQLAYSYDGINWVGVPSVIFPGNRGICVTWGKDKFVAGGGNTSGGNKIYYSTDGINWIANSGVFSNGYLGIGFNGSIWVAVGNNGASTGVAYSYNGINWSLGVSTIFNSGSQINQAVAWSGSLNRWVATGLSNVNSIYYSTDGINWSASTGAPALSGSSGIYSVTWAGNRFVAGGGSVGTLPQYTSPDGINWTANGSTTMTSCLGLAWSSNQVNTEQQLTNVAIQQPTLALGAGTNTIAYSYDGISWRGLGTTTFASSGQGARWNGKLWVAGGISFGVGVIAYSFDGINWTTATQSILNSAVYSIAWNGTVFVAAGQGTTNVLAYSYNGINWIASATRSSVAMSLARNVTWGQNYFVAVGSGGTFSVTAGFAAAGTVLTVSSVSGGTLAVGQLLTGGTPTALTAGTYITGPTGSATFTGSFVLAGTLLTVSGVTGTITVGQLLSGGTVTAGTSITGPTGSATFTGSISGTTLSVSAVTGTIAIGQLLSGGTVSAGTYIVAGSGLSWTVNNSQTATATTSTSSPTGLYWTVNNSQTAGATATSSTSSLTTFPQYWTVNNSQPITGGPFTATYGYYNAATFTGSISTTTLTVSAVTGTISIGQLVYGGTVSANTYITAGSGLSWTVNNSQTATATGSAGGGAAYSTDGINWTPITSAYVYYGSNYITNGYNSVIFADNRWLIYSSNAVNGTYILYTNSLTASNPWIFVGFTTSQSSSFGITYGFYPVSSSSSGTLYGTVLIIGIAFAAGSGFSYSTNGGASWTNNVATATPYPNCIAWNGKRFLAGFTSTVDIRYSTNTLGTGGIVTLTSPLITNPTAAQLFTSVNSFGTSGWPILGSVYVDSAVTISSNSGLNTNNQLDIYSDTYFNNGYNNMALTVKATQIP